MSFDYSPASRDLQDRFDTRRLADRLAEVKVHHAFTPEDRAFIEGLDMLFMASVDDTGQPTCSYKGGDPGFVSVLDEHAMPPEFFDLSTRLAGELVHRRSLYRVRLAAVVPDAAVHSAAFQDFVREASRGRLLRFFPTRAEAIRWACQRCVKRSAH